MSKTQAGARVSAGAVWLLWTEAALVFALFLFASIVSFNGLYSIAPWVGLPVALAWALPLAIDLGIIGYKVAEVILRYDERKAKKVRKAIIGTVVFTAISSAGNVIHVAAMDDPNPLHYWGGIGLAAIMPWFVYLSASVLADLLVKPYRNPAPTPAPEPVAAPAAVAPRQAPARPRTPRKKPAPKPKATPKVQEGQQVVDNPKPFVTTTRPFEPVMRTVEPEVKPFEEAWTR